jgi:hypothetical protein
MSQARYQTPPTRCDPPGDRTQTLLLERQVALTILPSGPCVLRAGVEPARVYPARVLTPAPPIKSRLHHRNACGAGNRIRWPAACLPITSSFPMSGRRGSNPRVPVTLPAAYKTEGIRPSWPPRSRTELYRLIRAAPTTGWAVAIERKMRVSSPAAARTATGIQSPLPRRRRTFHRGERRTRTVTLARSFAFEATPAAWRVHSPCRLSRPVRAGGRWQRTEQSKPAVLAAARFPAGADHLAGSSSEESG